MTWLAFKALLKAVPLRVWAWLAVLVLAAALVLAYGNHRAGVVRAEWAAADAAREAADVLAQAKAAEEARKTEARHRAEYRAIAQRFLEEKADADKKHAAVVAGLRDGSVRVRQRLTCPSVPGAAGNPAGTAEEGPRGFQPADAEAALGIAARADEVARQLNALIEAVEAGRK